MTPALASSLDPAAAPARPERAHRLAILAIRLGLAGSRPGAGRRGAAGPRARANCSPTRSAWPPGSTRTPTAVRGLRRLGFGFVETGTVVPRPQPGNPRPRVFRLEADRAVINRYGMNSQGLDAFLARLAALPRSAVPLGANVGINKEGADPARDYPRLVAAVAPLRRLHRDQRFVARTRRGCATCKARPGCAKSSPRCRPRCRCGRRCWSRSRRTCRQTAWPPSSRPRSPTASRA